MFDVDAEREPIPGYDFTFAPYRPRDPEYRQTHMGRQLRWLEDWEPMNGSYPQ
jgi:hypothetical protein